MILAANFKTFKTRASTNEYITSLNSFINEQNISDSVYIFPPLTAIDNYSDMSLTVGVQNSYATQNGAFTGEVGLEQLNEFDIDTILIGHSERRHVLGESQEDIAKKYQYFKDNNFTIIYCVGEPLEVYEEGFEATMEYIAAQFNGIDIDYDKLIIAYEPVWAIGTGKVASIDDIKAVHTKIKDICPKPILYGGSVKTNNLAEILKVQNVEGALVGSASLDVEGFKQMLSIAKEITK